MKRFDLARVMRVGAISLAATLVVGLAACGGNDGGGTGGSNEQQAVTDALAAVIKAQQTGDAELFLAHVSDHYLKTEVGASRDDVRKNPDSIKAGFDLEVTRVVVSGKKASADVVISDPTLDRPQPQLVKEGDTWKLDRVKPTSAVVPAGAKRVSMDLNEFAFGFVRREITPGTPIVLETENKGKQSHFVDLVKVPEGADVQKLLQDEKPEGVEFIGHSSIFAPGEKADLVIGQPLVPGRYLFVCFVGDAEDGTPHAFKGMLADFKVQ